VVVFVVMVAVGGESGSDGTAAASRKMNGNPLTKVLSTRCLRQHTTKESQRFKHAITSLPSIHHQHNPHRRKLLTVPRSSNSSEGRAQEA
jgi:hypothetical protein